MQSDTSTVGQRDRTFVERARRAQIVDAAVKTIAELGYAQASLARIAERVGISKGVIAYHFAGKEELMNEVVADVLRRAEEFMRPQVEAAANGRDALRVYIASNLAFMREYRDHLLAVVEIARGARRADGSSIINISRRPPGALALQERLAAGQRAGDFRADFDPGVMTMAIRAAIDTVPPRLQRDPELDIEHIARELTDLFERATEPAGR